MPALIHDSALKERLARVRLIVFDIDGVMTDGRAYYDANGMAMKAFSMRDGFGFVLARFAGIEMAAITGNLSDIVRRRLEPFGITRIKGGNFRKTNFFREILDETGIPADESVYIGDDLFDIPVMELAGFKVAPADGHRDAIAACDAVTEIGGGYGVIREVVEAVIHAQGRWEEILEAVQKDEKGGR